jgi:hypothetical protein
MHPDHSQAASEAGKATIRRFASLGSVLSERLLLETLEGGRTIEKYSVLHFVDDPSPLDFRRSGAKR